MAFQLLTVTFQKNVFSAVSVPSVFRAGLEVGILCPVDKPAYVRIKAADLDSVGGAVYAVSSGRLLTGAFCVRFPRPSPRPHA